MSIQQTKTADRVPWDLGEFSPARGAQSKRRAQPDEGVLFLTNFAVTQVKRSPRNIHYGIGGVKIDVTIRAAPRNKAFSAKKQFKLPRRYG